MKKSLQRFLSLVLVLVLFIGSTISIYSGHLCSMENNLNISELWNSKPSNCEETTKSCCSSKPDVSNKECCEKSSDEVVTSSNLQFFNTVLNPPVKSSCCIQISGYFGILLYRAAPTENSGFVQIVTVFRELNFVPELLQICSVKDIQFHPPDASLGNHRLIYFQTFRI